MRLSGRDCDKISLHCHAMAVHFFPMFLNPKNRGPNFTWEGFPELLAGFCETQAFLNCTNKRKRKAYEKHGYETGKSIGEQMVKEAGL